MNKSDYVITCNKGINKDDLRKHLSKKFDIYDLDIDNDSVTITTRKLEDDKLVLLNREVSLYSENNDPIQLLEKKVKQFEKDLELLKNELTELKNGRTSTM